MLPIYSTRYRKGDLNFIKTKLESGYYKLRPDALELSIVSGNLELIKYLHEKHNLPLTSYLFNEACGCNANIEILKYFDEKNIRGNYQAFKYAIFWNNLEIVKWLHNKKYRGPKDMISYVCFYGTFEMIEYIFNTGYYSIEPIISFDLQILKFAYSKGCEIDDNIFYRIIQKMELYLTLEHNHLIGEENLYDILEWLFTIVGKKVSNVFELAVSHDLLELLQFLTKFGKPNEKLMKMANRQKCIQFLHEKYGYKIPETQVESYYYSSDETDG